MHKQAINHKQAIIGGGYLFTENACLFNQVPVILCVQRPVTMFVQVYTYPFIGEWIMYVAMGGPVYCPLCIVMLCFIIQLKRITSVVVQYLPCGQEVLRYILNPVVSKTL